MALVDGQGEHADLLDGGGGRGGLGSFWEGQGSQPGRRMREVILAGGGVRKRWAVPGGK
ncbi:MAG: hypothetical protein Kow0010_17990 [Dehalococcoidia bacterium]